MPISFPIDPTKSNPPIRKKADYKEIFDNLNTCVAIYEPYENGEDFIFKEINKAAEKTEKIKKEQLVGKKVTEIFPSVKKFGLFYVFRRVNKTGNPEHHPETFYKDERIEGWRKNYVFKLSTGEIIAVYEEIKKEINKHPEVREKQEIFDFKTL